MGYIFLETWRYNFLQTCLYSFLHTWRNSFIQTWRDGFIQTWRDGYVQACHALSTHGRSLQLFHGVQMVMLSTMQTHSHGRPLGDRSFDPMETWILCGLLTDSVWSAVSFNNPKCACTFTKITYTYVLLLKLRALVDKKCVFLYTKSA